MKKKIRLILILLAILLIIIFIILKYITINQDAIEEENERAIIEETVKTYFSDKVLPQGVSSLYGNYQGKNDKNDLYRSIAKMLNYLPTISSTLKNVSDEEISEYYAVNESQILEYLGIDNIEDFKKLVEYIKQYNINNEKYQYCSIDSSTYIDNNEYLVFNLNIVYENIDKITLKVCFANSKTTKPKVIFLSE